MSDHNEEIISKEAIFGKDEDSELTKDDIFADIFLSRYPTVEPEYLTDDQLRERDKTEVAEWRDENGDPLSAEDQAVAVQRFAELREEMREQINKDNEGENDD